MALERNEMVLTLVLVLVMWHGVGAQSTCMNAIMSLTPCSNYLTGGSVGPSTSCCSQLNSLIQNQPQCMCSIMNGGGAALGTVASQALPGACSLKSPSIGQCNVANGPTASAASPASAPSESQSPGSTPSETTTPSSAGSGSKTVPSTNNASSGATISESSFFVAILLLLAMSFDFSIVRF